MKLKHFAHTILILAAAIGFSGCATKTTNLVFIDANKFGLSMSGSTPEQKADITLGYSSASFALVPANHEDKGQIIAEAPGDPTGTNKDALSVFAHFGMKGSNGSKQEIQIGRFFATGVAAQSLASGFGAAAAAEAAHNGGTSQTNQPATPNNP